MATNLHATPLPTVDDIRAALDALDTARESDAPPHELQAVLIHYWHTCGRFNAQADAVELLNELRSNVFKRNPVPAQHCPRLYVTRRVGRRRSTIEFYPSTSKIARAVLTLPGARHRCADVAHALGADVRNIKLLWSLLNERKVRRVAA